jgi:hypothetical protein
LGRRHPACCVNDCAGKSGVTMKTYDFQQRLEEIQIALARLFDSFAAGSDDDDFPSIE